MEKYFEALLNEEFVEENQDEVKWNKKLIDEINKVEFLNVINKIKSRKAVWLDISVETWKQLGEMKLSG